MTCCFFPLFDGYYPDWIPAFGGDYFLFFSPVFNIADSSIFIGVVTILALQKRFFAEDKLKEKKVEEVKEEEEPSTVSVE